MSPFWYCYDIEKRQTVQGDYGLKIAYTDVETINASNVVKVVGDTINIFYRNRKRADYLWRYKNGDQPVLYRDKTIRDDINNPICENQAWSIIHFLNGQETGEPIQTNSTSAPESLIILTTPSFSSPSFLK